MTDIDTIKNRILTLREKQVMLDGDIAECYGVSTKQLNQAVKRNSARFPSGFMFQLSEDEKDNVVTNCDHLNRLKYSPTLPYAFTEQGVAMWGLFIVNIL
ncbi:MAG: ORF6N domain-containing protein [Nanoarchaeota archaeon]